VAISGHPGPAEQLHELFDGPDTVTRVLETLTAEALVADVVSQCLVAAGRGNPLGVDVGQGLIRRVAVLRGRTTGRPYVCARSLFAPHLLREPERARLAQTSDPIGRVLADHDGDLSREPLDGPEPLPAAVSSISGATAGDVVWSRAYRLLIDGRPLFVIDEWFLRAVLLAL
jgi:chorismate lyase